MQGDSAAVHGDPSGGESTGTCRDTGGPEAGCTGAPPLLASPGAARSGPCRRDEWWDADFAAGVHFTGDLLVAAPDVVEAALQEDDEFVVLATDGLWCAHPWSHAPHALAA